MTHDDDRCAELLSLAVHEFRTPVSVVAGYLRILLRHFDDTLTDQQRKLIQDGERSCGTLTGLLSELSDLANLEAGHLPLRRDRVDLAAILARLPADVQEGADRGVTATVEGCGAPLHLLGDPDRLAAAFAALMTAVLRERSDRTEVVLGCRIVDGPAGRMLRLAIDEADRVAARLEEDPREGDGFDEHRGGMGFRFVLASRIIAAHGGRVATPVTERGRLAIVATLPVAREPGGVP